MGEIKYSAAARLHRVAFTEFIVTANRANLVTFFAWLPHDTTEPFFGELDEVNRAVAEPLGKSMKRNAIELNKFWQ